MSLEFVKDIAVEFGEWLCDPDEKEYDVVRRYVSYEDGGETMEELFDRWSAETKRSKQENEPHKS